MTLLAIIALFGWVPFVAVLFALTPARTAAATAVVGGWLLLPPNTLAISALPDYSKITAATAGMILGALIFDPGRILAFRPCRFDVPMLLFCLSGIASSLQNGLGLYDGLSDALNQSLTWGLPYLFGRLYFGDPQGLRAFAVAMAVGGLCYVVPCLWEMKMSPQLLRTFYGAAGWQGTRLGGYRPNVFFRTGLELGMWMTAASMAGWWLWYCGALKKIGQIPFGPVLMPILLVTTILCRSSGAIGLLAGGMMVLWFSARFRRSLLLVGLLCVGPLYVTVRVPNLWTGQQAVELSKAVLGRERAHSLDYRFTCEKLLIARAVQQPIFGWGGWLRSAVYFDPDEREHRVPPDGLWIILLGSKGYTGLMLFYVALSLPAFLFVWRFPARRWGAPELAAGSLASVLLALYMIDCLLNGFPNIIYVTLAGGLSGLRPSQLRTRAVRRRSVGGVHSRSGAPPVPAIGSRAVGPDSRKSRMILADRYRNLGRTFKHEGRGDEAVSAWRQALDLLASLSDAEPQSSEIRKLWCDCANDLVWLKVNDPDPARRDLGAAVTLARQMVQDFPDVDVYWNTLGVAYYRAGDDAAAVAALDRATTLGGGTAFDDVFLAMAHARLGNMDEARRELARASIRAERDYPDHPELAIFCDEARSILAGDAGAPVPTYSS